MVNYTDYCTTFFEETTQEVWFYDEIADKKIGTQKVKDELEANNIMDAWVRNAPQNIICDKL